MTNEERYKEALLHVVKWIEQPDEGGVGAMYKPLNAQYANGIAQICRDVALNGMTTEEAVIQQK